MLDLATTTIALLAPWLAKVGEGATKKLGETAVEHLGDLYDLVKSTFTAKDDSLTLLHLEQNPNDLDAQKQAANVLMAKLKDDPVLNQKLGRSVERAKKDPAVISLLTQVYGGQVDKIVNIGNAGDVTIS